MCGQNPVWGKINDQTLKMGSRSHNHCQIFAACHLCRLAQDYYKHRPRTSLTLLGVKIIATNANNNVDVTASLNLNIHTLYFSHDVNYSHEYVTFWYVWNVRTTIFEILILDVWKIRTYLSHLWRIRSHVWQIRSNVKVKRICHKCAQLDTEASLIGKFHSNHPVVSEEMR